MFISVWVDYVKIVTDFQFEGQFNCCFCCARANPNSLMMKDRWSDEEKKNYDGLIQHWNVNVSLS